MMTQTKALITGIGGFVGPYLAKTLLQNGYQVIGLIQAGIEEYPPSALSGEEYKSISYYSFDLSDQTGIEMILKLTQPDVVFHLAGFSSVKASFEHPEIAYKVNSGGIENLLEALRKVSPDSKFIFVGSSEEYGLQISSEVHYQSAMKKFKTVFPAPTKIPELPVDEMNPLRPLSPYAVSKVYGDFLTRNYWSSYGLQTMVVRAFNHEGAGRGEGYVTTSIIRQCVQVAEKKTDRILIGNVGAFRDWSHVEDIVNGYRMIAENGNPGDVYVLGSRRMNSVLTYLLYGLEELDYHVDSLETFDHTKKVGLPLKVETDQFWGMNFVIPRIDDQFLSKGLSFELEDRGLLLHTNQGIVNVIFEPDRFRPADIPLIISNPAKAEKIGFTITKSLKDIICDQVRHIKA